MEEIALGLMGVAAVALLVSYRLSGKKQPSAPGVNTGNALRKLSSAVSVEGTLQRSKLLNSPVTHTPCLAFEVRVVATWTEGKTTRTEEFVKQQEAIGFAIDDGSGPVHVDPSGAARFAGMEETFRETKSAGELMSGKAAGGRGPTRFGRLQPFLIPPDSKAENFLCTEKVFRPLPSVAVTGKPERDFIAGGAELVIAPGKHVEGPRVASESSMRLAAVNDRLRKIRLACGGVLAIGAVLYGVLLAMPRHREAPPGSVCAKAITCCNVLAPSPNCSLISDSTDAQCEETLAAYRRMAQQSMPARLHECD